MSRFWQRLWKHPDGEPGAVAWVIGTVSLILPGTGLLIAAIGGIAVFRGQSYGWLPLAAGMALIALDVTIDYFWARTEGATSDLPHLNRRGDQLTGRIAIVAEPIVAGRGKVKVGDTLWAVEGPDLPSGNLVRVTAARATVLLVESVEPAGQEASQQDVSRPGPHPGR